MSFSSSSFRPLLLSFVASACGCGVLSGDDGAESAEGGYTTVGECTAVGHHVSVTTCQADHQCGTVALPFCTIGQGVRATTDGEVRVARGTYAATELRDGVTVLGGWAPTFAGARDPNPETNETVIETTSGALSWPDGATATVDGVRISVVKPARGGVQPPSDARIVSISGSAHATLRGVRIDVAGAMRLSSWTALGVRAGHGGSVTLDGVVLVAPRASYSTYGIRVDHDTTTSITATDTTIACGDADRESGGIDHAGAGSIVMKNGSVHAGRASTAFGIRAAATSGAEARVLDLEDVVVEGNRATSAFGIAMTKGTLLRVSGGAVRARGPDADYRDGSTVLAGIVADSVAHVLLEGGAEIAGGDGHKARHASWEPHEAYGVKLTNAASLAGAHATIRNVSIEGSSHGLVRRGVFSAGVPLVLSTSKIIGSRTPVEYGYFGPVRTVGVEITGTFPSGARIDLVKNAEIVGGDVSRSCEDWRCASAGIAVDADVDTLIEENALIRGSYDKTGFAAKAIQIVSGATHTIRKNARIVAGTVFGQDGGASSGIDVVGRDTQRATVIVEDNVLVGGAPDAGMFAHTGVGFHGMHVIATVRNNGRLVGGFGWYPKGVWIERGATPNEVTITNNTIDGGSRGSTGLLLAGAKGRVERNTVHACELPDPATGQPAAECAEATNLTTGNRGLVVDWDHGTVVANNYVFAREVACSLGRGTVPGDVRSPLAVSFVHNACIATGPSWRSDSPVVAFVLSEYTGRPLIANNILDGKDYAFLQPASEPQYEYALLHNALVPRGQSCLAYVYLPGQQCYASASDLNARSNAPLQQVAGNVSLDPGYASPAAKTAAGYHLDASCALGGRGTSVPAASVTADWDGDARHATPTIGPDECL